MIVCNRSLVEKLVQAYSVVEGLSANNLKVPVSNILSGGWQRHRADLSLSTDLVFFLPFIRSFIVANHSQSLAHVRFVWTLNG